MKKNAKPCERVIFDYQADGKFSRSHARGRGGRSEEIPQAYCYLNDNRLTESLFTALTPRLADWLEIAHAVYLADRLILRGTSLKSHAGALWGRHITIQTTVRDSDFWNSVKPDLEGILYFLTEDEWNLDFQAGAKERVSQKPKFLFPTVPSTASVMLASGGLDSLAGAIIHRKAHPDEHLILVSAFTNQRIQKIQSDQAAYIAGEKRASLTHVAVGMGLSGWEYPKELEKTQRSRGFFHLSLGCITALTIGGSKLTINENGIGALNLPFDRSQVGAQNSRPVNPIALKKMAILAGKVGEMRFSIVNPFILTSKAEMCELSVSGKEIFPASMSCDHPQRSKNGWHCGICTSCLLRRMSLHAAGISVHEDETKYCHDLAGEHSHPQKHLQMLEKMEWQVSRFSTLLGSADPWRALSQEFPMLARSAAALLYDSFGESPENGFMELLSRYVKQWKEFPARKHLAMPLLEAA